MNVREALLARKSVRAFRDRPVAREQIERILDAARHAPSGANAQPWQVVVVTGKAKARIEQRLLDAHKSGIAPQPDYAYYPKAWFSPYKERRFACGMQLYQALGIAREDRARREAQWAANYRAFGAPVALFFFMDRRLGQGSLLDYGMFLQSIMLMAIEEGLATCPQAALAEYPSLVREALGIEDDWMLLCGMALGYEDTEHPVNSYRTPREDVRAFTRFVDEL